MKARLALNKLSDAQLVVLARQQLPHASNAYEELMRRYEKALLSFCRNTCGSQHDAEDVLQEVLLSVFHHLSRFRGESTFKTWLYRIAYNECVSLIRRRKDHDELNPETADQASERDGDQASALVGDTSGFYQLLTHLEEEDRSVIALRLISDLEFKDIASITGAGLSAVKMRYQRALKKLEPYIEEQ